ncbi:MAG: orotidine-5'-phosphate decarboxylase [Burkholderiales bacterium]
MIGGPRVIVALDLGDAAAALSLVDRLSPDLCRLKVGKELFTSAGPGLVAELVERGYDVFLDLKFHDIPNTVAQASRAAARLGVWMLNVHALGGSEMMQAARDAVSEFDSPPKLIAVTVLTSLAEQDLRDIGIDASPEQAALRLAALAHKCGLDGVVCSAHEAGAVRDRFGGDFLRVTPGIRLTDSAADDQKRIMAPATAIASGASYLVIGRPIARAADPLATLRTINNEIAFSENRQ